MTKLEKTVLGLEICGGDDPDCQNCPYYGEYGDGFGCETIMQRDALSLLKAQMPRVMTPEEVEEAKICWIEDDELIFPAIFLMHNTTLELMFFMSTKYFSVSEKYYDTVHSVQKYGKTWRCWNAKPTNEQRKATPWND